MKKNLSTILRGYKVLHKLLPGYMPAAAARAVFGALLPFVNILVSAMILNALAERREMRYVISLAIIAALINFAVMTIMHLLKRLLNYLSANIETLYEQPLNEKQLEMDFEQIEDPATRMLRQKIFTYRNANGDGLLPLFWAFEDTLTQLLTVIFSVGVFASVFTAPVADIGGIWSFIASPWFTVLLALTIVGNAVLNMVFMRKSMTKVYEILKGFHFPNMIGRYLIDNFLMKYHMGKDIRLYKLRGCLVYGMLEIVCKSTEDSARKVSALQCRYNSYGSLTTNALSAMVYIYVAAKAVLGGLGIGSIVQYVGGINRFTAGFTKLAVNITWLLSNMEALNLYFQFLDMPDKIYHGKLPVEKRADNEYEIEFHNVSFKYPDYSGEDEHQEPDSGRYALKNLNLKLRIGQKLAVVGMNGSGKTTMIKLLCRLYDPTDGMITLNGIDIKKYRYDEYMNIFSVVFQDFSLFSFPLGQNVAAGIKVDTRRAMDSLKKAGLSECLSIMPKGLDTPLYKDFDDEGVEVSGGEAQKIALARALYKNAPFIVLDEPTAALDPIAEFEIYSAFNKIVENKTAIYISHRLSSCRFCDDIAVFHDGELIQRGSHDTLLSDEYGKYYELWNAQAQYYVT